MSKTEIVWVKEAELAVRKDTIAERAIQSQFGNDYKLSAPYVGSKGTNLNIERNYNQFVNGVRPFAAGDFGTSWQLQLSMKLLF